MATLSTLLENTRRLGSEDGLNVVAFSGGVDSSLVAYAVAQVFPDKSMACIGLSAALPMDQLELARQVAHGVGIPLRELATSEGELPEYVANNGAACFFCKTTLYGTLEDFGRQVMLEVGAGRQVVMFNGTNQDDLRDPTRLGLKAAANFQVASPLVGLTKIEVRQLAREVGLPNWNYAASPCLRSRLQLGVAATPERLRRVEKAERLIRTRLDLVPSDNLRVRVLEGEVAAIEVDDEPLERLRQIEAGVWGELHALGFSSVQVRPFLSGSLSHLRNG